MTETPIPVQFDAETLAAAGVAYEPPGQLTTAHPHLDRATKGMLNYAAKLGPRTSYRFFLLRPGAPRARGDRDHAGRASPPTCTRSGSPSAGSCSPSSPSSSTRCASRFSGRPYIENYRWKPELGTRFTSSTAAPASASARSRPRPGSASTTSTPTRTAARWSSTSAPSPTPAIVEDLYMDRLRAGKPPAKPHARALPDRAGRRDGRAPSGWSTSRSSCRGSTTGGATSGLTATSGASATASGWLDRIVKADVVDRRSTSGPSEGCFPGEPVFVAAPEAEAEDEGVLLSVVLDGGRGNSFLLVLDARTLEEVARAEVPHHIPFGFHGQFARA